MTGPERQAPRSECVLMYRWEGRLHELVRGSTADEVLCKTRDFFLNGPGRLPRWSRADYVLVEHVYL